MHLVLRLFLVAVGEDQRACHSRRRRQRGKDSDGRAPAERRPARENADDEIDAEREDDPGGDRQRFVLQNRRRVAAEERSRDDGHRIK
jgi:hypothetical protein